MKERGLGIDRSFGKMETASPTGSGDLEVGHTEWPVERSSVWYLLRTLRM